MSFLYSQTAADLAEEKLGKEIPVDENTVIAPEFIAKTGANATLSDEFCALVVDIFKGNIESGEFGDKMIEYIKEF